MNEETKEAGKRLRQYVDAWVAKYGNKGFIPRVGDIPSLAVRDLALVLNDWEGVPEFAVISQAGVTEDGFIHYKVHSVHVWQEDARAEAARLGPGHEAAWWDGCGNNPGWRPVPPVR